MARNVRAWEGQDGPAKPVQGVVKEYDDCSVPPGLALPAAERAAAKAAAEEAVAVQQAGGSQKATPPRAGKAAVEEEECPCCGGIFATPTPAEKAAAEVLSRKCLTEAC
ncbi:hypothetical protein HaLaN_08005 [Haematococcus lacustris]|uniref:Uncharacterized protein n=1 Tax=Haematococcus lacustris TaxID=44745 RepID=A0A699YQC5_HAELA|nr:hypothetical protein HaLaN_08005 [Haematococcus lacustris]